MTEAKHPTREELIVAVGMLLDGLLHELAARCPTGVKIGIEQGSREQTELVFASIEPGERLQSLVVPSPVVPMIQGCLDRIFYVRENVHRKRETIPGGNA